MREKVKEELGSKIRQWQERSSRRIYISIDQDQIVPAVDLFFKKLELRFCTASACQNPEGFEMLYFFSHDKAGEVYVLRTFLNDKDKPQINSITPLFAGAEWIEREIWELMGIDFAGHPNLKRLLLADEWPQGEYPLRKEKH